MNYNNKFFKYLVLMILILLILLLLEQIDYILIPLKRILTIVSFPFIGSGLFYYMLRPLINLLEKKKINRTLTVVIVFIGIIGIIAIGTIYGGSFFKNEFSNFYSNFSKQLEFAEKTTKDILNEKTLWIFSIDDLKEKAIAALEVGFRKLSQNITGFVGILANIGTVIVLIPFVLFFLLKDGEYFHKNFMKLIKPKHKKRTEKLLKEIDKTLSVYITGQLIVALVIGILTYIGYLIIGLPNVLMLALFSMITSVIPFLGPFLGILPAIFIALTTEPFMVIKVLIVLTAVQQLEGNLISPNIIGQRLHIHPLTIIFLVIIAISLYGFIGAFIAIPVYSVIRVIIKHFFGEYLHE